MDNLSPHYVENYLNFRTVWISLELLEKFVQDNPEAHALVKHDLSGDLDTCLSELMPRVWDFNKFEKEVFNRVSRWDRFSGFNVCNSASNSFHSGNQNRKSRVKKACGVKVLYDCKVTTMGELQNHQEMIHAKVFSCGVCEKTFRKESYFKTHKDIHVCSKCGVCEKFKGTICDTCKGKKMKSLLRTIKSSKKSSLTPMKSTLGRRIRKKKATASLSKFLFKSRSFRN